MCVHNTSYYGLTTLKVSHLCHTHKKTTLGTNLEFSSYKRALYIVLYMLSGFHDFLSRYRRNVKKNFHNKSHSMSNAVSIIIASNWFVRGKTFWSFFENVCEDYYFLGSLYWFLVALKKDFCLILLNGQIFTIFRQADIWFYFPKSYLL